jgi:hypothetical protein
MLFLLSLPKLILTFPEVGSETSVRISTKVVFPIQSIKLPLFNFISFYKVFDVDHSIKILRNGCVLIFFTYTKIRRSVLFLFWKRILWNFLTHIKLFNKTIKVILAWIFWVNGTWVLILFGKTKILDFFIAWV